MGLLNWLLGYKEPDQGANSPDEGYQYQNDNRDDYYRQESDNRRRQEDGDRAEDRARADAHNDGHRF